MKRLSSFALAAGMACMGSTVAQAQSVSGWEFQVTPYAWMAGLNGRVGTVPGLPPVDVDLSFSEILEDLDIAGMAMASARSGPWVIFLDANYVRSSSTEQLGGVAFDSVKLTSRTTTLAFAVGRTLSATPMGSVDAYVGARAWWLENTFDFRGAGGGQSDRTLKANWVDPLVGVAGRYSISDRWTLFGALEAGGFGVGADSEWSLLAGATYRFSDSFGVNVGWRHLEVDYDEDDALFDVSQSGPVIGATFNF